MNRNPSCCHLDSATGGHIDHIQHLAIGRQHDTKNRHPNKLNHVYLPKDTWYPRYVHLEHLHPNMPKMKDHLKLFQVYKRLRREMNKNSQNVSEFFYGRTGFLTIENFLDKNTRNRAQLLNKEYL